MNLTISDYFVSLRFARNDGLRRRYAHFHRTSFATTTSWSRNDNGSKFGFTK
ncbi:MAG: hypothetical protein IJ211_05885 [Campylobacter sp.]|nr:hypothetical protein [Campylobacter sp.]